jgi:prolyl oligopeptidase
LKTIARTKLSIIIATSSNSPDTKQYVEQELAYTRSLLDPLPGRDRINARLSQLLTIGTIGAPQIGGPYYFYTRREGTQNQPVLYVREGLGGTDRVLVDVNKMSTDGTIALDWWFPVGDGKLSPMDLTQWLRREHAASDRQRDRELLRHHRAHTLRQCGLEER